MRKTEPGFQRIPAGIDVGCLGVVDVADAIYGRDVLQTVFHSLEILKGGAYLLLPDVEDGSGKSGGHGVVEVVEPGR